MAALDDPRISRMYARLLGRHLKHLPRRGSIWLSTHRAEAALLLLMVVLAAVGVAIRERGRGHLSRLKSELKSQPPAEAPPSPQPGGQDPIVLQRSEMAGSTMPEFLSATLLPGRGMNTLQITAYLPDKGEVQLLASPTVEEAARRLTGTDSDQAGATSLELGGALELPWAGVLPGVRTPEKNSVQASWHGHLLNLPSESGSGVEGTFSDGGLLLRERSSSISSNVMPDGGESQARYTAGNFGGRWPSKTDVTVTVLLSGRAIEIRVVAHNSGTEPEPIGIGWRPRFAVLSGDRSQVRLHIPSTVRLEQRGGGAGLPTGRLLPVGGTAFDFSAHDGMPLRSIDLEDTYVHLRPALLDIGPMVEMRDPKSNYGLRLTAMTPTIRALRVESRPQTDVITIDPRFNYDDPFGREWSADEDTGMVVLEPGKTTQWRIRLELFPLSNTAAPGL